MHEPVKLHAGASPGNPTAAPTLASSMSECAETSTTIGAEVASGLIKWKNRNREVERERREEKDQKKK
jgi:hypothetical protein